MGWHTFDLLVVVVETDPRNVLLQRSQTCRYITQFKEMKSIRKICNRIFSIYKIINQIHPFLKTKTTKTISD